MTTVVHYLARRTIVLILIVAASALLLTSSSAMIASAPAAPADYFNCTPTGVAAFIGRVHVRCNPAAPGGISYFAVCTTADAGNASRFLSIFTTAKVTGKNLDIFYTASDTSGTACGCAVSDCRVLWGAEVNP